MSILQEITEVLERAVVIANQFKRKLSYVAVFGLLASGSIAWLFYSPESSLGWNILKCGVVLLPALVICFVWQILNSFAQAPVQLSRLASEDDGLVKNLQALSLKKPQGLSGLIRTVRELRSASGLNTIVEAVGGIALLTNPLVIIITCISLVSLLIMILVAPLVVIFS